MRPAAAAGAVLLLSALEPVPCQERARGGGGRGEGRVKGWVGAWTWMGCVLWVWLFVVWWFVGVCHGHMRTHLCMGARGARLRMRLPAPAHGDAWALAAPMPCTRMPYTRILCNPPFY